MRWLGRLILLAVLGWFAFGVVNSLLQWQGWRTSTVLDWEQDFAAYPVFWLDGEQTLVFDIPANSEQVRVQLTPTITGSNSALNNTANNSEYRVHYQLFNDSGVVADEATRHYLLDQTLEVTASGPLPDRFFELPDGQGAQLTNAFFIDNRSGEPVRRLTLALQKSNIDGVAVRVSVLERKNEQELSILWQRMHRDKRLALMAENIYPAELVSEEQRRTALKYSWLPLGPEGVEGEEYKAATLFIKNLIVAPVDEQAISTLNHMITGPKQVFTFFQSAELAIDTLSCETIVGADRNKRPLDWLELLEQDPQNPQTLSRRIFIGADLDTPVKLEDKPVLYQIRTSALCQLSLIDKQGEAVVLPPKVQRSYLVNPATLEFALTVQGKTLQPIRLDVRGLAPALGFVVGAVDWQVQDKDGNNILSGKLDLLPEQDMFEALLMSANEETLLIKNSAFILAPADGVKLIVQSADGVKLIVQSADAEALVSVFTRPLNLIYKDGYKDDVKQGDLSGQAQELPQWFMLLPKNSNRLKADGLSRLIYRQQRPKLPAVVEPGLSQWQALKNADDQPTYPLFVGQAVVEKRADLKNNAQIIDATNVAANYQLIEAAALAGTEVSFSANFVTDRQAKTLSPKLVYVQQLSKNQPLLPEAHKVQISIDGKTFDYWLGAQAGQITLTSINAGEHNISIVGSNNTLWYINHLAPQTQGHGIRSAYALEDTLTFEISKTSDKEWVSFYYFPQITAPHNMQINLKHRFETGEYVAHTIPVRAFAIPDAAPIVNGAQIGVDEVYLLNQNKSALRRGYLLKFPLDKDLSPGPYFLSVSSDSQNSGFVQASYLLSDVSQLLYHFVEVENAL
jgi:hypothetical protein